MAGTGKIVALIKAMAPGVDPSSIEQAVTDWLDDHPEATTTVEDGSITEEKLASDVLDDLAEIDELKEAIVQEAGVRTNVSFTTTANKYVDYRGQVLSANGFSYTSPIAVKAGDVVEVYAKGYSTNVAMVALTDSTGSSYTPGTVSNDSTLKSYFYTVNADGYISSSYNTASGCKITIRSAYSNKELQNRVDGLEQKALITDAIATDAYLNVVAEGTSMTIGQAGKYIHSNGSVQTSGNFNISSPIALAANSTIKFNAKGYLDGVSVLAKVNGDGTYTPIINSVDSNVHTWVYTTFDPINVVISTNKEITPVYSIYASKIDELDSRLSAMEDDLFAYASMGVIGDSLASGASNYSGGVADRPAYSWGKYIERVYGTEVSLFTNGGMTTRDWLTASKGLIALNAADPLDCYVIGLGQNDQYSYGQDYIGTVSDVHVGSEDQNADTYYGNYSKIIAAIKAKSPRAKIFCLTNAKEDSTLKAAFNTAIKTIVPLYTNTYLIDLTGDAFYTSNLFNSLWYGAHSTAVGYKLIAKNIHDHICEFMRQNITEFMDIQWIVDNHP